LRRTRRSRGRRKRKRALSLSEGWSEPNFSDASELYDFANLVPVTLSSRQA